MATKADLLTEVKNTLNITVSTYDTELNSDLDFAVKDLYPLACKEVAPATVTLASDLRSFTVPSGSDIVRRVEINGYSMDYFCHGGTVYLMNTVESSDVVTAFCLGRYVVGTYADIPSELETVLIYWAVAKFYTALAGNKRKYNIYVGNVGSAADRDMKDSADYFKELGDQYLEERVGVRGF